jgi:hypothetical protein
LSGSVGVVEVDYVCAGTGEGSSDGRDRRTEAALLAEGDAAALERARSTTKCLSLTDVADQLGPLTAGLDAVQLIERRAPEDAVGAESDVSLEVGERQRCLVSEDAVDPAGVEAQSPKPLLELGDIIAAEHGRAAVHESITEAITGLHQCRPRLRPANTIDSEAPPALKALDGGLGISTERPWSVVRCSQVNGRQPTLEVLDAFSAGAPLQRELS